MYAVRLGSVWRLLYQRPIDYDESHYVSSVEEYETIVMEDEVCRALRTKGTFELSQAQRVIMSARITRMCEEFQKNRPENQLTKKEQTQRVKVFECWYNGRHVNVTND
jgi:hypothetical protein